MKNEISEYDVVEVIAFNPDVPEAEIGDQASVLMIFFDDDVAVAYEVECVLPNGSNKWEGTFSAKQIKLVQKV